MSRSFFPRVEQEDGVAETYLESWTDFDNVVKKLLRQPTFVFRGQRDSEWLLEPSLTRLVAKRSTWKRNEADYMPRFRLALRGRLDDQLLASLSDDELLAIGQHFGLATPLLDWSESPYVALFFAFEAPPASGSQYRTVCALDEGHVRGVADEAGAKAIGFIRPRRLTRPSSSHTSGRRARWATQPCSNTTCIPPGNPGSGATFSGPSREEAGHHPTRYIPSRSSRS